MLKRYKTFSISNIIWIFVVLTILWTFSFFDKQNNFFQTLSYTNFLFKNPNSFFSKFLSFLFVALSVVLMIFLTLKFEIFPNNSLLPIIIFILLSSYIPSQTFSPVIVSNVFILFAFFIILNSMREKKSLLSFFYLSTILFIAGLIYYPHLMLILMLIVFIFIIKSGHSKELWVVLFTYLILLILFIEIVYIFTSNFPDIIAVKQLVLKYRTIIPTKITDLVFIGIILFYTLISLLFLIRTLTQREIRIRTIFSLFLVLFVYSLLMLFIPAVSENIWQFLIIPLSFIIGYYFQYAKQSKINKILFDFLFVLPFIYQIARYFYS